MGERLSASRRGALLRALFVGAGAHGAVLAWAALLRDEAPPLAPASSPSYEQIDLVAQPIDEPRGEDEAGGGSALPGSSERAEGSAPEPVRVPAAVAPPPTARIAAPAPPESTGEKESLEHGNAEDETPEDLFALDALLSEEDSAPPLALAKRAKPAWKSKLEPGAVAMAGKGASLSGDYGTGRGKGGGAGGEGTGRGSRAAVGVGTPFGGASGAFTGSVCFIPPFTRSIRSMGACRTELVLHTDVINVPTTHFEHGFPGITERTEWFAILYRGRFRVARTGEYLFRLASDDGSILRIDGEVVIDHDGLHGPVVKRGSWQLSAGEHELDLRYFQGPRALVSLQLWVTPPGAEERLFGPSF